MSILYPPRKEYRIGSVVVCDRLRFECVHVRERAHDPFRANEIEIIPLLATEHLIDLNPLVVAGVLPVSKISTTVPLNCADARTLLAVSRSYIAQLVSPHTVITHTMSKF